MLQNAPAGQYERAGDGFYRNRHIGQGIQRRKKMVRTRRIAQHEGQEFGQGTAWGGNLAATTGLLRSIRIADQATGHSGFRMRLHHRHHVRQSIPPDNAIRVEEQHIGAARTRQNRIVAPGKTQVGAVSADHQARLAGSKFFQCLDAAINRAIVGNDDLDRHGRAQRTLHALEEQRAAVVADDDYGNLYKHWALSGFSHMRGADYAVSTAESPILPA